MTGRRYGQWAGNPKGAAEIETNCIVEVWPEVEIPADVADMEAEDE